MVKRIKRIALSLMATIFAVMALSAPVFATPNDSNTVVTDDEEVVIIDEPIETIVTEDEEVVYEDDLNQKTPSCSDQVGSLAWIVCPGVGLFGKIIDGAYDLLTSIIEVNPLPTDYNSPIHIVWEYFRDITNIIFVIFFLVVILSQITGFGINNYGIKKVLPRIIITAILVNLSYVICTLAVDVSNILGNSFQAFFENIENIAITNGTISSDVVDVSVSGIIAALLGIGAAGTATLAIVVTSGGWAGLIWVLLPILLSGIIAVFSAVLTMAARQAFIFLLVMISPIAIVAYMLPNTEKWFQKWYHMLSQMLFFYPMFSVLYGASQLASYVIITSATNWLGVILGIAVRILPLFLSIPLMRMSNTMLGKISGIVGRIAARPQAAFGGYAMSKRADAMERQIAKRNPVLGTTRLAQFLHKRKALRDADTMSNREVTKLRDVQYVTSKWYNNDGTLSKRGYQHIYNEQDKKQYMLDVKNINNDFNEGFKHDGTDNRVKVRDLSRMHAINDRNNELLVYDASVTSRERVINHNNAEARAKAIQENVMQRGNEIHQKVLDTFRIDDRYDNIKNEIDSQSELSAEYKAAIEKEALHGYESLNEAERALLDGSTVSREDRAYVNQHSKFYNQALNYTLSDAIAARRKLDKESEAVYYELYDDSPAGTIPGNALIESFKNGDYSQMSAAIKVMSKRGDHGDILKILSDNSDLLKEADGVEDIDKIRFQKEINDVCLSLKGDNQIAWAWAKANMIRRGKYNGAIANGKEPTLASFIDFKSFLAGSKIPDDNIFDENGEYLDEDAQKDFEMVNMFNILKDVNDGSIFAGADKTMWKFLEKGIKNGSISANDYYVTEMKHLRKSMNSGKMDGEKLRSIASYITMGFRKKRNDESEEEWREKNQAFFNNEELIKKKLEQYFGEMSAGELTGLKSGAFDQFNDAMMQIFGDAEETEVPNQPISATIKRLLSSQITQLNKPSAINARMGMNINLRKKLGIIVNEEEVQRQQQQRPTQPEENS